MPFRAERAAPVASFPITRIDRDRHEVWGWACSEELGHDGLVLDFEASVAAFGGWAGNVREAHSPKAVGRCIDWRPDYDQRMIWVGARVVDPTTWAKVEEGVLRAFSVNGDVFETEIRTVKRNGRDVPVKWVKRWGPLRELSLVDVPGDRGIPGDFAQIIRGGVITDLVAEGTLADSDPESCEVYRGAPLHPSFTGSHSHEHAEYDTPDGGTARPHSHMHSHDGDANHGHDHEGVHGIARGQDRTEGTMDEPTENVQRAEMDEDGTTEGPTHGAFDGTHTHPHAGSDGETHEEEHSHDGDGDHGHPHEAAQRSAGAPSVDQIIAQAEAVRRSAEETIALLRGTPEAPEAPAAAVTRAEGDGEPDAATEQTDADLGKQAIALLRELVAREAAQYAAGGDDEVFDIQLLLQAIDLVNWFVCGELNEVMEAMRSHRSREEAVTQVDQLVRSFAELATTVEGLKAAAEESVQRAATAQQQEVQTLSEANAQLVERVARLEAQPMPGGPALTGHAIPENKLFAGVRRAATAEEPDDDEVAAAYQTIARSAAATQPVRELAASAAAMTLMRQAQRNPQQMDGRARGSENQE